jgi:uncharacterized protein YjbI with pentapeptide repeats
MKFIKHTAKKSATSKPLDIDAAKKLLDTSAEKNRNLLIAFMAYLATATILALSITDLDLLVDQKTIQLPLLSVGLPMWAFYTVIPLILLLLHFDVLQNVQEHNKKLDAWLAHKPADPGSQLFPYILDFARVRYGREVNPSLSAQLVAAGAWLMYIYLPLVVLALFFIRFADLQGVGISVYHLGLGLVDYFLLWQFWRKLRNQDLEPLRKTKWLLSPMAYGLQAICVLWVFGLWACIQSLHFGDWQRGHLTGFVQSAIRLEQGLLSGIGSINIVPRIVAPHAQPYQVKDDDIRLAKWLNPDLKEVALWDKSPLPIDWEGRRLAFADLQDAQLRRVSARGADLQGANLSGVKLQGANLEQAQLQGADFRRAQLKSANFSRAQLNNANFLKAQLQGADLSDARMQFAFFTAAHMHGARLGGAHMIAADLQNAQLQGVNLGSAQLQGANLSGASLHGANLGYAQLQGAHLVDAKVLGVTWPIDESSRQGMFTTNIDSTTAFDFSRLSVRDEYHKARLETATSNQKKLLSMPSTLGTKDFAEHLKIWLSYLCSNHAAHQSMVSRNVLSDEKIREQIRTYVRTEPRCNSYRAMTEEILLEAK